MAESWRLLRLVRVMLIACGLHLSSDQPGVTVNCSHGGYNESLQDIARLYGERNFHVKELEMEFVQDIGETDHPWTRPWNSPDSDSRGQTSLESGWASRRLMVQQHAQDVIVIGAPPDALPSPAAPVQTLPPQAPLPPPKVSPAPTPPAPAPTVLPSPLPTLFQPTPAPAAPPPGLSARDVEREAVLYFKGELTADPTGVFKLWNDTNNPDPCEWYGIKCNNASRIVSLSLPNRILQGTLTRRIANLSFLEVLDLKGNSITGPVPEEIGLLHRLRVLRFGGNSFQGLFPGSLASCTKMEELDVNGCGMDDVFPDMLRNFTSLSVLDLGENAFTGPIPIWLGWSRALTFIHLGGNRFNGDMPISLLNCTSLQYLNLSSNSLTGSVDSMVGNLMQLRTHLDISRNSLSGLIPPTIGNLKELLGLNLSGNEFTGSIPGSIGNCTKLQSLDLSGNQLSGTLPESLSLLRELKFVMDVSHNEIGGAIPVTIGDLQNLTKLDLSCNKLTGAIPETIASMSSLLFFNVSVNQLQGLVPDVGLFSSLLPSSFLANPGLCGRMVGRLCVAGHVVTTHKKSPTPVTIIGAAAEACVLVLFAVLLTRYLVHRRRAVPEKSVVLFSKYFKALKLTPEEIQAATNSTETSATSPFSRTLSGNIRRGAECSKIEKAVLPDGTVFAVKQWCITKFRKKDRHKLDAEMVNFSRIRHRNLVRLMGYYMNPSALAMLMEFCPNGSLDLHLHPPGQLTCQLKWNERLRIIMGVTTGLVYLHHETCGNAVVHCDLKAANVLLDSDMEPKLVDFGMALLIKRNSTGATAASWVGSSGYAPPEYGFASDCTKAGDVYSYGVLLLEIITGKRPSSEEVTSGMTLPAWMRSLQAQNRERYAIDMSLFQSADEHQLNQILHILDAAVLCTGHVPSTRPTMLQVLGNLQEMPQSDNEEELVPVASTTTAPVVDCSSIDFDN